MMIRWFFPRLWKICLYLSLGSCITCVFVDWHLGWVRDPIRLSLDLRLWRFMKILMVIQRTYYFNTLSLWITFWLMALLILLLALNAVRCNTLCYMDGTLDELNAAGNKYSKFWNTSIFNLYFHQMCWDLYFSCFIPVTGAHGGSDSSDPTILTQELEPYLRWAMQCFFMCLARVVTYNSYALYIFSPHNLHSYSSTCGNLESNVFDIPLSDKHQASCLMHNQNKHCHSRVKRWCKHIKYWMYTYKYVHKYSCRKNVPVSVLLLYI